MKKIAVTAVLVAFILSMCAGCFKPIPRAPIQEGVQESEAAGKNGSPDDADSEISDKNDGSEDKGGVKQPDPDDSGSDRSNVVPGAHPQAGFSNYQTAKGDALTRLTEAYESSDELVLAIGFNMLSVSVIDLNLMALSVLGEDPKLAATSLGIFGFTDIDVQVSGDTYRLTYTDSEGVHTELTCEYDAAKDQLKTLMLDDSGRIIMFFEYVRNKDTYISQYYYTDTDASYLIRCYFDKDNIAAFGSSTASAQPESIIGGSGFTEEFVKNSDFYAILKDGKLFVYNQGKEITN
ncbi:MAG: hypothetical protein GXX89_09810 [Clostridiales bacterium]|jgi:hypothetical protein|nr:hypothetical protein [Clostridiales bacterium]